MTALNVFVDEHRVDLWTDSAFVRPDGEVHAFAPKVFILGHLPAVIAVAGPAGAGLLSWMALAGRFSSFDALNDGAAASLRMIPELHQPGMDTIVVWAGWSEKRRRMVAHVVSSQNGIPGLAPWERGEFARWLMPNPPQLMPSLAAGSLDVLRPERITEEDGAAIMRAQRALRLPLPQTLGASTVGGCMQHTAITRDGISTRVVERWPDVIGQEIAA